MTVSLGPVMLDIESTQLSFDEKKRLLHPLVGGVILFSRNFTSREQLTALCAELHALKKPSLLIAVDHEGGRVQRFRDDFTHLPAMRELGKIWDENPVRAKHLAHQTGYVLAAELNVCGVDLSFTPVLDVDHGLSCIIGDRAFHRDPEVISMLAHHLMLGLKAGGFSAVGKHFPGHGYIQADTHLELSIDDRPYVDIEMEDMMPFRHLINANLAGIMSSHVIYPKIDKKPATFSSGWLKNILREEMQFEGCVFSDDLSMLGAAHIGSMVERAQAALHAGCDMVLVCNNSENSDQLLASLQWNISAISRARLARMHHDKIIHSSILKLREDANYVKALREVSRLSLKNQDFPFF